MSLASCEITKPCSLNCNLVLLHVIAALRLLASGRPAFLGGQTCRRRVAVRLQIMAVGFLENANHGQECP